MLSRNAARKTLGAIRFINGAAGLFAPELLLNRLGVDATRPQPAN